MANMFSGNVKKKIPKDLRECYKTDNVTHNLWVWCERLEKWGFRICIALAIIGIFTIIKNGIETAQLLDELNIDLNEITVVSAEYGIEIKSVFEVVIEGILIWTFYCFIEYCTYHVLALLVGSLATIVQNTKITANITLYNSAKAEGITDDYDENADDNTADKKIKKQKPVRNEKLDTLEKWKSEGLITEEEYEEKKAEFQRG